MKLTIVAGAGLLALAATVSAASAAPVGGVLEGLAASGEGQVLKVHGFHKDCEPGPGGHWHRHGWKGRVECGPPVRVRPARPHGEFWIWREEGGRSGWWHSKEKHWH
jgi:hypothetical protein